MRFVTWQQMMDLWHEHPDKLLAWLTKLFWDAGIDPSHHFEWLANLGQITIGTSRSGHAVILRLCNKCQKHVPWTQVTAVSEKECQCICHKTEMNIEEEKPTIERQFLLIQQILQTQPHQTMEENKLLESLVISDKLKMLDRNVAKALLMLRRNGERIMWKLKIRDFPKET